MQTTAILQKIGYWITVVSVFLFPLFFLPITSDFYEFNKNVLFITTTLILLVLWSIISVLDRQVRIVRSPLGLPLLALAVVWLTAAVLRSPNRVEAFLLPGQTGTWLAIALFYLTSLNFVKTKQEVDGLIYSLLGSMSGLGLISLLWSSNVLAQIAPALPAYLNSTWWNPAGSIMVAAIGLATALPAATWLLLKHQGSRLTSALLAFGLLIIIMGLGANIYRLFNPPPGAGRVTLLPYSTSWAVALEVLKISPLLGSGPATFLADFTQFRPVTFNLSSNWALRFTTSSNYPLQLLATLGIAGTAAYLFLLIRSYQLLVKTGKLAKNSSASHSQNVAMAAALSLMATFVTQLVLPVNLMSIWLAGVLIVIMVAALKQLGTSAVHEVSIDIVAAGSTGNSPLLPWIVLVLTLALAGTGGYLGGRAYAAEVLFQKALAAAARNDGKTTYDTLISTIRTNPYLDSYRVAYSQTNLLIANSLAANPAETGLTDADRATITQLVQQAIREAKNAVALNPTKVSNLENLAAVYRNLLNFAQGADAWTIASYQQAVLLDPVNPNLRIALGGVFYALKNWDEAIRLFQSAVDLKPDLANAHYNLAAAYRESGNLAKALTALQNTVQLVDRAGADYEKVQSELQELQTKVGSPAATTPSLPEGTAASQLTPPQPLPTPAITPPLQLDQSLSPEAPATPSGNP